MNPRRENMIFSLLNDLILARRSALRTAPPALWPCRRDCAGALAAADRRLRKRAATCRGAGKRSRCSRAVASMLPAYRDERREIHCGGFVQRSVDRGVHDVGAIRGGLRGVDLELRPQQPVLGPVLRREVAEHAGRIEEILSQFDWRSRCSGVGGAHGGVQAAQQVAQEQDRLAQMAEVRGCRRAGSDRRRAPRDRSGSR